MGTSVHYRFWSKVEEMPDGCWLWTGIIHYTGYGKFKAGGKTVLAHRFAWEQIKGELPPFKPGGLQLDHLCHVRHCVNPAHLELVTAKENQRRGLGPGRRVMCPAGHEYTPANTYLKYNSWRICKMCKAAEKVKYRQANRDKIRKADLVYYQANRDKILERRRVYDQAKRAKLKAITK